MSSKARENGLNDREHRFVLAYRKSLNATQAAIEAGLAPASARMHGCRMLKLPHVAAALAEHTKEDTAKAKLSAAMVLEAIRRPLIADPADLYDEKGNPKPLHELSAEARSLIAQIDTVALNINGADGKSDGRSHRYKLIDRARFVEMAAKHFKLLTDVHEHKGLDGLSERLKRGLGRAKGE